MEKAPWRLMVTQPAKGAWNMALDESILESIGKGTTYPTLRLYGWTPPCLSLGYAQSISDVNFPALTGYQWDLVRRPSGGKAILHCDELTYSLMAPYNEPRLSGDLLQTYEKIAQALLVGLHLLGIPAISRPEYSQGVSNQPNGPICFEVPSKYEITFNNKKLIGSAQARKKSGILQHGSLPLNSDGTAITQVLIFSNEEHRSMAAANLANRSTSASEVLQNPVSWESAASALIKAFEQVFQITFIKQEPTVSEIDRAEELIVEKYGNQVWTNRI